MQPVARFTRKLSILFGRNRFRVDLDEEMAFHREQTERELIAGGMGPEAAHYAAMRKFGNATRMKDRSQEVVGFSFETVAQDLRFAARQLRKNPGFAAIAVLILALGIGASVAIFAFVDAALIRPLPYRDPARLTAVYESTETCPHCNLSYYDYLDWKKENHVFGSFDVWQLGSYLIRTPAGTEPVPGVRVSDGFFRTLGVTPILGRDFYSGESSPNTARTVLLSYAAWETRFGRRPNVVGESITLNDDAYTIIGVLPQEFQFAPRGRAEVWTTLHEPNGCEQRRFCHNLYGVARLMDGVSIKVANADTEAIAQQLQTQYPDSNRGQGAMVLPLSEAIIGDIRPILLVLLGGATLLLLIACVNVSSLVLVRAEGRKREIAVRGALGASRRRLMSQFITEGLALVAAGTVLGLAFAGEGMHFLSRLISKQMMETMPFLQRLRLNLHGLIFALILAAFAAILFSLTPILRLPLLDAREGLAEGGRGSVGKAWRSLGANLVIIELATAVVLLSGAGLLAKSFYHLLHVDIGFNPDHLAMVNVQAPDAKYGNEPAALALNKEVIARVASLPGVTAVGLSSDPPLTCNCNTTSFRVFGHPWNGEHSDAPERDVSPGYFRTLRARMLSGRSYSEDEDNSKPPAVIINKTLARQFFPGEDPIGKKIGDNDLSPKSLREIVGVVDDIREGQLDSDIRPAIYYPMYQGPDDSFTLVVRTSLPAEQMLPTLSAVIHKVDPGIGVSNETTMDGQIDNSQTAYLHRSSAWLVGGFAALALLLGVVGLYGVIAYSVSQRTREIGVRMALGASRSSVYSLILKEAGLLIAVGVIVGLAASVGAARLMDKLLFGVRAWDAGTLIGVAVMLAVCAMLASYIPARRAASVNPSEALRAE
jgi:macrolide transport system ATP-binding/permease protein